MGRKWGCLTASPGPFLCPQFLDLIGGRVFPKGGCSPQWLGELLDGILLISQQPWREDGRHGFYPHSTDGKTEASMVLLVVFWPKRTQTFWFSALGCLQGTHDMEWPEFLRGLCNLTCPSIRVRSQGGWHSVGDQSMTELHRR